MKKFNLFVSVLISVAILLGGCNASNTAKGTAIGGGGGAAVGAGVGALLGGGKGAAWGAGIGAVVGGAAGALIGNKMDKQKKELEKIQNAQVESVNDGQAIKVTFDSGILFATNSSTLNQASINALTQFANSLQANPDTNVQIFGHTDSTGGDQINIPLSNQRAASVQNFLAGRGVAAARMTSQGMGSSQPVADNATTAGRQQNRRVEIYILPNQKMIQDAEAGTLK